MSFVSHLISFGEQGPLFFWHPAGCAAHITLVFLKSPQWDPLSLPEAPSLASSHPWEPALDILLLENLSCFTFQLSSLLGRASSGIANRAGGDAYLGSRVVSQYVILE